LQEGAELNEKKDYSNLGTTEERMEAGNREQVFVSWIRKEKRIVARW